MPVDSDPGPCRLSASLLPHERRSSKSECGRNAAGSDFTLPLYCLVLSCLIHLGPPSPLLGLLFVSRTVTVSTLWLGTRAAVQCASFSCLTLPVSQPALPAFALPCTCTLAIWVLCAYCAVASCRLQEPYCWNHTTRVLDGCPADPVVIGGIRFDPLIDLMTLTDAVLSQSAGQPESLACSQYTATARVQLLRRLLLHSLLQELAHACLPGAG